MTRRRAFIASMACAVIGIQWLGPKAVNPPVDAAVRLEAHPVPPPVVATLRRACYDCHSSETQWPWYARVAPASWLVAGDVADARKQMNFSRWGRYNPYDRADMLDKVCDFVSKHKMPLWQYRLMHPDARLSDPEIATLCDWSHVEAARLTQEEK